MRGNILNISARFTAGFMLLLGGATLCAPPIYGRCSTDLLNPPNSTPPELDPDDVAEGPDMRFFVKAVVEPVADEGARSKYLKVHYDHQRKTITLQSKTTAGKLIGEYIIRFTTKPWEAYPTKGLPIVNVNDVIRSEITVMENPDYEQLPRLQGVIRSMFRADRLMHPHLCPNAQWQSVASYPQRRAIASMMAYEQKRRGNAALKIGLFNAPGMGKTLTVAKYTREVAEFNAKAGTAGWKKKPRVLAVIQNELVLDGIVDTFKEELGLEHVSKIYGDRDRWKFGPDSDMIAITRSSYAKRIEQIHKLLQEDPDQPWIIMIDEGHHAGKRDGEFNEILTDLDNVVDGRHRIVLPSANLWHRDAGVITKYLQGRIVAPMLERDELEKLQAGEELSSLCRVDYYRSQEMGYLAPLFGIDMPTEKEAAKMREFLVKARKLALSGKVLVDPGKLTQVVTKVISSRRVGVWDRGVIFVRDTREANRYAEILTELFGTEVRPFHSMDGSPPDTADWISDRGDYAKDTEVHKYAVVVDKLREGVDFPKLNIAIFARSYGMSMAGFLNLLQNMGRIHRVAEGKPDARVYDLIGYTRWLRDGLERITVERRTDDGIDPVPHVYVGTEWMTPTQFVENYYRLFPSEATFYSEFPFFSLNAFRAGGFLALQRLGAALGITGWSNDHSPMRVLVKMAEALPDSDEKDELLDLLDDKSAWGVMDGVQGNLGSPEPLQRAFRALTQIAQVLSMETGGDPIEPDCSGAFVENLANRLFPWHRSLVREKDWLAFADAKTGAMPVLLTQERERLGAPALSYFGARDVMRAIARKLNDGPEKTFVLKLLGEIPLEPGDDIVPIDWAQSDCMVEMSPPNLTPSGVQLAMEGKAGVSRVYRAWTSIAMAWNKQHPDAQVDLTTIHLRKETEKLLNNLFEFRPVVTVDYADLAKTSHVTNGGAVALEELASLFGVKRFGTGFGPRDIAIKAIEYLRKISDFPQAEGDVLIAQIRSEDWGWSATDGVNIQKGALAPTQRAYRALLAIATLYARTKEGRGNNSIPNVLKLDLRTREGMHAFLTRIAFGFSVPIPNDRQLRTFMDQVFAAMPTEHGRRSDRNFWKDSGPKVLYAGRIRELTQSEPRDRVLAKIDDDTLWPWTPHTASSASNGESTSSTAARIYRAHYVTLKLARAAGELSVDPAKDMAFTVNREGFVELFTKPKVSTPLEEILRQEVPEPTDDELALFVDKQKGGLAEFRRRSLLFGVSAFAERWGARDMAIAMLDHTGTALSVAARDEVRGDAWTETDGMSKTRAANLRLYRAFYAAAVAFSKTRLGMGFDPKTILTRAGAHALVDQMVFGFVIPEMTDTLRAQFMASNGAFPQLALLTTEPMAPFKTDYGVKRMYVNRIAQLRSTALTRRARVVLADNDRWEWRPSDYQIAHSRGSLETVERIYRAHYVVLHLHALETGRAVPIAMPTVVSGASAHALFSTP